MRRPPNQGPRLHLQWEWAAAIEETFVIQKKFSSKIFAKILLTDFWCNIGATLLLRGKRSESAGEERADSGDLLVGGRQRQKKNRNCSLVVESEKKAEIMIDNMWQTAVCRS